MRVVATSSRGTVCGWDNCVLSKGGRGGSNMFFEEAQKHGCPSQTPPSEKNISPTRLVNLKLKEFVI